MSIVLEQKENYMTKDKDKDKNTSKTKVLMQHPSTPDSTTHKLPHAPLINHTTTYFVSLLLTDNNPII
jgi:hypothetical protein